MTAAVNDGEEDTPPQRVMRGTLVACIILAARLNHRLDLDEASAGRLIRHVVAALVSDPDNTLDSQRPFACRTDDGQLEEIGLFADYRMDRDTWDLTRVEQRLWGDPPILVHAGSLEVSWYKFEQAMAQALREAGPPPITGAVLPAAWSAVEAAAARAGNQVAPPPTDRPHASEVGSRAPLLRVHLDASEVLESPPDWPQLPPPASSEPLAAYTERAVLRDPFFQEVEKRSVRAGFSPCRPGALRPATYTLEWWQSNYPKRSFTLPWAAAFPDEWRQELRQLRELVFWRLIVELFERLRSGEFHAEGRRIDVVEGDTKVVAELWSNPNMLLLPRSEFQGKQRRGDPPLGPGLPWYIEVKLSPATAAKAKSDSVQARLSAALISLCEAGSLDIRPRVVRIDTLHQAVTKATGINASKSLFEKALKDARGDLRQRHSIRNPSEGT